MIKIIIFIFSLCCLTFAFYFRDLIVAGLIFFMIGLSGMLYLIKNYLNKNKIDPPAKNKS